MNSEEAKKASSLSQSCVNVEKNIATSSNGVNIQEQFYVVRYPAFKMTPLIVPSGSENSNVIEFTLVGQTDEK